jgi:hypothetical protein
LAPSTRTERTPVSFGILLLHASASDAADPYCRPPGL